MPIPLVVTKRYEEGQRVTSRWQSATQINKDPNRGKCFASRQVMRHFTSNSTNQMSKRFIEPPYSISRVGRCRLPTATVFSNKVDKSRSNQFDQQARVSQIIEIPRTRVMGEADTRASIQPSKALCAPNKAPRILSVRRSLSALVERKQTVVRDQPFPQKPPGSRL